MASWWKWEEDGWGEVLGEAQLAHTAGKQLSSLVQLNSKRGLKKTSIGSTGSELMLSSCVGASSQVPSDSSGETETG